MPRRRLHLLLLGSELYGGTPGLVATALWCFCPIVLGHGALVTPDVAAASMGVAACYLFWRWLGEPTWSWALAAGGGLGLAELTKFTWLILFAAWPLTALIVAAIRSFSGLRAAGKSPTDAAMIATFQRPVSTAAQLAAMLSLAVFVINVGYGFSGSCGRLGDQRFVSRLFKGSEEGRDERDYGRHNRFAGTWLKSARIPLPGDYVLGIDVQRRDFEAAMPTFFRGAWRESAPWYAYLYGLAIKLPLGTLCVLILAAVDRLVRRGGARDEFVLLFPALVLLAVACGHTGLNSQVRYVLPALPFLFIWAAKSARGFAVGRRRIAWLAAFALAWSVAATLYNHPHHLSYFNELCRWPRTAPPPLLDSNLDWGQDLVYLREWSKRHPETRPLRVACYASFEPADLGIDCLPAADVCDGQPGENQPPGGWYALSLGELWGRGGRFAYFRRLEPVAVVGTTIHIYHLTRDEK
ncbi:MAG TPA: glycosyltransferase family 39 protein [Pirellulales bacterium]|nr:glycosyltransferase family 39 protein [Pirellulales bacterium]